MVWQLNVLVENFHKIRNGHTTTLHEYEVKNQYYYLGGKNNSRQHWH